MTRLTLAQLIEYTQKVGLKPEDVTVRSFGVSHGKIDLKTEGTIAVDFKSKNGVEIVTADQMFGVIYWMR